MLFLGRSDSSQQVSCCSNVEEPQEDDEDDNDENIVGDMLRTILRKDTTYNPESSETNNLSHSSADEDPSFNDPDVSLSSVGEDVSCALTELQEDALEYICGYILKKLNISERSSTSSNYTWVDHLSEGGLVKPTEFFTTSVKKLETIFQNENGKNLTNGTNWLKRHWEKSRDINLSQDVKILYFKIRLYNRLKILNMQLQTSDITKNTKKRKLNKTINWKKLIIINIKSINIDFFAHKVF